MKKDNDWTDIVLDRIKEAYGLRFDTELSDLLDVSRGTPAMWRHRKSIDLPKIISKCNDLDFNWLFTGIGNPIRESIKVQYSLGDRPFEISEDDLRLPVMGYPPPGMQSRELMQHDSIGSYGDFLREWLERGWFDDPENVFICEVSNLAMAGLFGRGDYALVERVETIESPGIYAFWIDGMFEGWHIDRIKGDWHMIPHYPPAGTHPLVIDDDCKLLGEVRGALIRIDTRNMQWMRPPVSD